MGSRVSQKSTEVLDQERKKISMTIMIASGRYKKMRINQSKDNLRYGDSKNKGYEEESSVLEKLKKDRSKILGSEALEKKIERRK